MLRLALFCAVAAAAPAPRNAGVHAVVEELAAQLLPATSETGLSGRPGRVAVVELEASGERTKKLALGRVLTDLLTARLTREPSLELLDRKPAQARLLDPAAAQAAGKLLGADLLLTGSVSQVGTGFDISARLVLVEQGRVAGAAAAHLPASAVEGAAREGGTEEARQGIEVLEAALQAYAAKHAGKFRAHYPETLEGLVPEYLERLPQAKGGRWLYDPMHGRVFHSAYPALRPANPRLNMQGLLDDSKKLFLKEQAEEIKRQLAYYCVEKSENPHKLADAMKVPPIPARYQGVALEMPAEGAAWEYDPQTGKAWNARAPEISVTVTCGAPKPPPKVKGTESFLSEEVFAGLKLVPGIGRFKGAQARGEARTSKAAWQATSKGLRSGNLRFELTLPGWSSPMKECAASGDRLWCLLDDGRMLAVEASGFPVVSARLSRGALGPAKLQAEPDGVWLTKPDGTKAWLEAWKDGAGSSKLIAP